MNIPIWLIPVLVSVSLATFGSLISVTVKLTGAARDLNLALERIGAIEARLSSMNALETQAALLQQQLAHFREQLADLRERLDRTEEEHARLSTVQGRH